jgi:hypothetical protein
LNSLQYSSGLQWTPRPIFGDSPIDLDRAKPTPRTEVPKESVVYDRNSNGGHDFLGMGYTTRDTVHYPLTTLHSIHRQHWGITCTWIVPAAVLALSLLFSAPLPTLSKNPLLSCLMHASVSMLIVSWFLESCIVMNPARTQLRSLQAICPLCEARSCRNCCALCELTARTFVSELRRHGRHYQHVCIARPCQF